MVCRFLHGVDIFLVKFRSWLGVVSLTKLNNTREVKDEIVYEILANEEFLTSFF